MSQMTRSPGAPASLVRLRPLRLSDEQDVCDAQAAMAPDSFEFAFDLGHSTDWGTYVTHHALPRSSSNPPYNRVPNSYLVAVVNDVIVGRTSIRHELNDSLLSCGGHIGYGVLPLFRGRGYASRILQDSLVVARAFGVERALLTCAEDNTALIAVIEKCGGIQDAAWPLGGHTSRVRRYWIA